MCLQITSCLLHLLSLPNRLMDGMPCSPLQPPTFSHHLDYLTGYGVRAPTDCWVAAVLVAVHSLLAVLFDSIILGIAFARISHPKNRGRTVLISNCSVISRRDGVLKVSAALDHLCQIYFHLHSVLTPLARISCSPLHFSNPSDNQTFEYTFFI